MSKFSKRLKLLRKQNNMTQEELANKLDIGKSSISHLEHGRNNPDIHLLKKLSEIFNVTTDYLLGITSYQDTSRINRNSTKSQLMHLKDIMDEMEVEYIEVIDEAKKKDLSPEEVRLLLKFSEEFKEMFNKEKKK